MMMMPAMEVMHFERREVIMPRLRHSLDGVKCKQLALPNAKFMSFICFTDFFVHHTFKNSELEYVINRL